MQDRKVVAEGLPGGRRGHDDHIPPLMCCFNRLGLVGIETLDTCLLESLLQGRMEKFRERAILPFSFSRRSEGR